MEHEQRHTVLIVDDAASIRESLSSFLSPNYSIITANNGFEAIESIKNRRVDFALIDVNMPEMNGLSLIDRLSLERPEIRHALMTSHNVNDYLNFARKRKVWNIIPKHSLENIRFIGVLIQKALDSDIFGINKYFPEVYYHNLDEGDITKTLSGSRGTELAKNVIYSVLLKSSRHTESTCEKTVAALLRGGAPSIIGQIIEELVSNALYRAPIGKHEGTACIPIDEKYVKYAKHAKYIGSIKSPALVSSERVFHESEKYQLCFGLIEEETERYAVVGISDSYGSISREKVLYRLERQSILDQDGLPMGIHDDHGRGLFISRENLDHLIINIEPQGKTEIIGILSLDREERFRALSIFQTPA